MRRRLAERYLEWLLGRDASDGNWVKSPTMLRAEAAGWLLRGDRQMARLLWAAAR